MAFESEKNIKPKNNKLLIAGLVVFLVGIFLGIVSGILIESNSPATKLALKMAPAMKILSSKAVQSIPVYGQVSKINGNVITISYAGQPVSIKLKNGAQIFSSLPRKDSQTGNIVTGAPANVNFSDIKVGDQATVTVTLLSNGDLQGNSVYIFASMPSN